MEEKNENKISHSFAQNTLFDYKKKIFLNVSICFVICIILVSERVFNSTFITWELDYIDYVQKYLVYSFNLNPDFLWLYKSVGSLGDFRILTLFMTHIFISVYVGFDVIIGLKVLLVHCVSLYFFTILEIIYQGPRPFWIGEGFITLYCDNSFTNPSSVTFVFFLDGSYLFLLYLKNTKEKRLLEHINTSLGEEIDENSIKKKTLLFKISVALGIVLAHFTLFLRYLIGLVFILDYFMGLLYFAIFFSLMTKFDNYIDKLLKSSTLLKKNARQLVFAWITFLIFANLFAYVIYLCCKKNIPVLWMKNFMRCVSATNTKLYFKEDIDSILGIKPTFVQTVVLFGLLGGISGAHFCFKNIPNIHWYQGSMKNKLIRCGIANLFMIPSWILVLFETDILSRDSFRMMGLNNYILDMMHFTLLFFFLYGILPIVLVKLKITKKDRRYSDIII